MKTLNSTASSALDQPFTQGDSMCVLRPRFIHNTTPLLLALLLSLALTACSDSDDNDSTTVQGIDSTYQGLWIAESYGRILEIGSNRAKILDYTSEFCLPLADEDEVSNADIESLYRRRGEQLEQYGDAGTTTFSAPGVFFTRTDALPASCADGLTPVLGDNDYVRNPADDLRLFYQLLDEYSIYPEIRGDQFRQRYADQAALLNASSSDADLLEAFFQVAEPLADIHTAVESDLGIVKRLNKPALPWIFLDEWSALEGISEPSNETEIVAANAYIEEQLQLERAITLSYAENDDAISQAANDLITWFANGGIGYLAIDAMMGFGNVENVENDLAVLETALDRALTDLQDVQALVVDIRRNGGGRDVMSLAIARRFAANETLAYRKQARLGTSRTAPTDVYLEPSHQIQYLGPVFLLTSPTTASAAETFTLSMRELPQVTLVGEATQGGFSDALEKELPNGFDVSLANEYYLSATDEWFETLGVPIDVPVEMFTLEARQMGVDAGLEAVIELLEQS